MNLHLALEMFLQVLGGLGLFLLGMRNLSDGIQSAASSTLRRLISAVTDNRFIAIGVGMTFTGVIQSSSICTVMVVGLVNSGVMNLWQAIGVILGSNIGTTITAWILVIKIGKLGLPIMGAAALVYLFAPKDRVKFTAQVFLGLGMVFFGLQLMTDGFKPLRTDPAFVQWFTMFHVDSYLSVLKVALVGCLVTFAVQSSSATVAITMGLASNGVINFETAAALILGENLGTTITAILASLGAGRNAKRAAYAHVFFNLIGVLWVTAMFPVFIQVVKAIAGVDLDTMVSVKGENTYPNIAMGIAMAHSTFNITNTILFSPFLRQFEKFIVWITPEKPMVEPPTLTNLNKLLLDTPVVALSSSRVEVCRMARVLEEMMSQLGESIVAQTMDRKVISQIFHREELLDKVQNEITVFLTELMSSNLSHGNTMDARQQLHTADEYESISDYVAKLMKLDLRLRDANLSLPAEDLEDILDLHKDVQAYITLVAQGYERMAKELLFKARPQSEAINHKIRKIRLRHISRLSETRNDPLITMVYSDMLNDYRRVKDHALNVAEEFIYGK
ncbi:MAG: Na/Pi cotransporter family protein [Nitrospinota bacterium]|nr:Na/Pi cotransporter family protein [Nitrospinota bacterium]